MLKCNWINATQIHMSNTESIYISPRWCLDNFWAFLAEDHTSLTPLNILKIVDKIWYTQNDPV